jgi:hypothetical protein
MAGLNDITAGSFNFGSSLLNPEQQFGKLFDVTAGARTPGIGDLSGPIDIGGGAMPGAMGGFGSGFGLNMDTARLGLSGLGTLGSLYAAFQAQKLANKQFSYTKKMGDANLANQIKSYNTTLEDRSRSRAVIEGQSSQQAQSYIDKNRLTVGG